MTELEKGRGYSQDIINNSTEIFIECDKNNNRIIYCTYSNYPKTSVKDRFIKSASDCLDTNKEFLND